MSQREPEMLENDDDIVLYILLRNDLDSLTGTPEKRTIGKACAQVSHASNQCVFDIQKSDNYTLLKKLKTWEGDRGFGTCIVLQANVREMYNIVEEVKDYGHFSGITHDPTYPLKDGKITHLIPLDTCAYIFGSKSQLKTLLNDFLLMY